MKIAIIGYGFVGKSVHNHIVKVGGHSVGIDDSSKGYSLISECDVAFVCVPTPTEQFDQDISLVETCIQKALNQFKAKMVVVKSTILPKHAQILCKGNVIYVPEFLDQANPYAENSKHIVGTESIFFAKAYQDIFGPNQEYFITSPKTASMIKYVHNTHGALKVAFFNEVFDICQAANVDYREMLRILLSINDNVSEKYTRIAADGQRGFGGTCFPKDTSAFVGEYSCLTLQAALNANKKYERTN